MYIDTGRCQESFHEFKRDQDRILLAFHSNGEPCNEAEYDLAADSIARIDSGDWSPMYCEGRSGDGSLTQRRR